MLHTTLHSTAPLRLALVLLIATALLGACATSRTRPPARSDARETAEVKDNRPDIWTTNHPRVKEFRKYYARTTTVEKALENGRRYLPDILEEFAKRRLPEELAYLPMLESRFENRADSGHARGLWQFTPQTAEHMGLRVGMMIDDRLNWRKATAAAARYLDELGKQFNYNWALALAAYNGGPNYVSDEMGRQHSWNFWDLRLRRETAEYVPRFIAMLQVAREKYAHMFVADLR